MTFNSEERLGLSFTVMAAGISLLCVTGIILYTTFKRFYGEYYESDVSDSNIFLNLMVADLIHSIGVMFNIKWAVDGAVTEGAFCTSQGIVKQIGNAGISFTSLAIAVYTFCVLVLTWEPRQFISWTVIATIWVCTGLIVGIPNFVHRHETYYGNVGFWCYIAFPLERIVTDYVWVWFCALVMLILYPVTAIVVYCMGRGTSHRDKHVMVAKKLLCFPVAYIVCVLPNTILRWLAFSHHKVPTQATFGGSAIHAASGIFNFVVFAATRPAMVFGIRPNRVNAIQISQPIPLQQSTFPYDTDLATTSSEPLVPLQDSIYTARDLKG